MRVCEWNLFSYLRSVDGEWHSKPKISIRVDASGNPHPNPLPVEREIKNFRDRLHVMPRTSEH